ncbi:ABC transporter permease [Lusitaniella coriacea]|uniref:ABC transporter permease n=1 Tax=Lusitaniella coriacea TaxID=1983105 RepID=UPI003CEC291B
MTVGQPSEQKKPSNLETRKRKILTLLLLPGTAWLLLFFVAPLLIVLLYSFLERGTYGGVLWQFSLENYQRLSKGVYWVVLWRSISLALLTTVACLLIGYPIAFFIATRPPRWRSVLLLLVIIPFWTNFLVRTYAWIIILRKEGVVNVILQSLHIIDEPLKLVFTPFAVILGLIYGYLPFMILPLYATLERFDFSLVEAGQDLGGNDLRVFFRVVLPLTMRGIISGSLLVFIPSVGAFITPDILGGAKGLMIGNVIQDQFLRARNEPFGSVLSILMMAAVLIPVWLYFRVSEDD